MKPQDLKIAYLGDGTLGTGFSNAAIGYLAALQHCKLGPEQIRFSTLHMGHSPDPFLAPYCVSEVGDYQMQIVHSAPNYVGRRHCRLNQRYNVAVTAWEFEEIPRDKVFKHAYGEGTMADGLNLFDEIIVPSRRNRDAFRDGGVVKPIHVVPHALHPIIEQNIPRKQRPVSTRAARHGRDDDNPIRFYYVGAFNDRKDVAALVQAFSATGWTKADNVELCLYISGEGSKGHVQELVGKYARNVDCPAIGYAVADRPMIDIARAHASCDIFVTASRGEGFGLPIAEALAHGNEVIASSAAAHAFPRESYREVEASPDLVAPIPGFEAYDSTVQWHRVNVVRLVSQMKAAVRKLRSTGRPAPTVAFNASSVAEQLRPLVANWCDVLADREEVW